MRPARTFALIAMLGLPGLVHGQAALLGGRLGTTSAKQTVDDPSSDSDRRHGMSGGFTGALELMPWFSLGADLLYTEKGAKSGGSYEMRLDYLELPLHLRLSSPVAYRGLRAFFDAGIVYSHELRCAGQREFVPCPNCLSRLGNNAPLDCDSQRKRHDDQGHAFGGGMSFSHASREFTLEIRRTRGLQNIGASPFPNLRNDVTALYFGAAHRFNIGASH